MDPCKIECNPGLRALSKLLLNSLWGKFAQRFIQTDAKTNVVIAAFTTAHARLMLYEELDMLKERVLYYDTDSIIYLTKLGETEPRLGNYIGELTDELGGDHITIFASGGPKNYCYETNTGKVETKVRGITLDCTARKKVNLNVIRALVFLRAECQVTGRSQSITLSGSPEAHKRLNRNQTHEKISSYSF